MTRHTVSTLAAPLHCCAQCRGVTFEQAPGAEFNKWAAICSASCAEAWAVRRALTKKPYREITATQFYSDLMKETHNAFKRFEQNVLDTYNAAFLSDGMSYSIARAIGALEPTGEVAEGLRGDVDRVLRRRAL